MAKSAWFRRAEKVGTVTIPVNPVPASRPRVGRFGAYYSKTYRNWRDAATKHLRPGTLDLDGPLLVKISSVVQKPKTTKLDHPKPDVDNYAKAALDAITRVGGYWQDDYQVVELIAIKRWTRPGEEPHTLVEIYECRDD